MFPGSKESGSIEALVIKSRDDRKAVRFPGSKESGSIEAPLPPLSLKTSSLFPGSKESGSIEAISRAVK